MRRSFVVLGSLLATVMACSEPVSPSTPLAAGHELREHHRDRNRNNECKQDDDDELFRGLDRGGMLFGHGRGKWAWNPRVSAMRSEANAGAAAGLSARLYRPGPIRRNRDGRGRVTNATIYGSRP